MSGMFGELFRGSALIGWTLVALVVFIAVFVWQTARVIRRPVDDARLPLEDDDE
jgi:hypothetical protein